MKKVTDKKHLKIGRYYYTKCTDDKAYINKIFNETIAYIKGYRDGKIIEDDYILKGEQAGKIKTDWQISIYSVLQGMPFSYYLLTKKEEAEYKLHFVVANL